MATVPDRVRDDLLSFDRSAVVFAERFDEFREQYPDEWLGLYEGEVIFHDRDHQKALMEADARKDLVRNRILVEFVGTSPVTMIL